MNPQQVKYDPSIEKKWHGLWQDVFKANRRPNAQKKYILEMFPYPSGDLHIGHLKNYMIGDTLTRYYVSRGYDVLHPFGWDAFGLPAENAAIKNNINPKEWTHNNIAQSKQSLLDAGIMYDWDREITTCASDYYKWTQWLFLLLYKKGLAYKATSLVNWDPIDQTVLANEQVNAEGRSWRSGAKVEKRELDQWFFKITDYAERLLKDLDKLTQWPERVKAMQRHWIGKSEGADIHFTTKIGQKITVFSSRPDTLWGASFLVLAPEHSLVKELTTKEKTNEVDDYVQQAKIKTDIDRMSTAAKKTGVFIGSYATNPVNNEDLPIFISDYVLTTYGTGAIMAVPAHDERDFEFAKTFDLPIRLVIQNPEKSLDPDHLTEAYCEADGEMIQSGSITGIKAGKNKGESIDKAIEFLEKSSSGKRTINYRLRDWLISRQRYWGTPIPMAYTESGEAVPIEESALPVELPEITNYLPKGKSPLASAKDWVEFKDKKDNRVLYRDTDTMDTFVDSSWYFLRFLDAKNDTHIFSKEKASQWMPVSQYIGGIEHAVLHLLYSRFITKVLYDEGLLSYDEPFEFLFTQGMVQRKVSYPISESPQGTIVIPDRLRDTHPELPKEVATEDELNTLIKSLGFYIEEKSHQRVISTPAITMSKSAGNGVPVGPFVEKYGSDVARIVVLFAGPPENNMEWTEEGVAGAQRFLSRTLSILLADKDALILYMATKSSLDIATLSDTDVTLYRALHRTIKKVTIDTEQYRFNTAIAALMELLNEIIKYRKAQKGITAIYSDCIHKFVKLLSPFAPHLSEEIFHWHSKDKSIFDDGWPEVDERALIATQLTIVVQVNGKVRDQLQVSAENGNNKELIEETAKKSKKLQRFIVDKTILKVIVVPNKIINFVAK